MDQKARFIIIGLIVAAMAGFFLFAYALNQKQALVRERGALQASLEEKGQQLSKMDARIRAMENEKVSLSREIENLGRENQELQKRYELASKAKDELAEKLKAAQRQAFPLSPAAQPAPEVTPGTDAYWAGILKAKTDLEMQLVTVRNELRSLQIGNEQLQREKAATELDVSNLRREREDLRRQLEYNKKMMDSIAKELVREKNDKMQIGDSLKAMQGDNLMLTRQLKALNAHKINLEKKVQDIQEKKGSFERRLGEMEVMLTDRLSQINSLKEQIEGIRQGKPAEAQQPRKDSVELPSIVVRPSAEATAAAVKAEGRVVALRKEHNFLITDLGEEAGIKVGNVLQVFRDGAPIAAVEVIQVRKGLAAADIKKSTGEIKIGDTVR